MNLPDAKDLPIPQASVHMVDYHKVDSTKLQAFLQCPRAYFFEYVLGWRADRTSNHLVFGQAWHSALEYLYNERLKLEAVPQAFNRFLEVYRQTWPESTDTWFGGKTPEAALRALVEYCQQNAEDIWRYQLLATEVTDHLPLWEEQFLIVKLDAVLQDQTGRKLILEHKTGSQGGQYWARQWHLSVQIGAYIAACNHFYNQEETQCIIDGTFFLKTKRNFQREIVSRSNSSLVNWSNTVVYSIQSIEREFGVLANDAPNAPIQQGFPQNPTACEKYGGCQFFDLCTCVGNPLALAQKGCPTGFKEEWWNPLANDEKKESE